MIDGIVAKPRALASRETTRVAWSLFILCVLYCRASRSVDDVSNA
jgi:hypothetical protein